MSDTQRLRNEDFRRLLATPGVRTGSATAALGQSSSSAKPKTSFTHKQAEQAKHKPKKSRPPPKDKKDKTEENELFEESQKRLTEILSNYRDRAAERRKGELDENDIHFRSKLAGGMRQFRDEELGIAAAERREQEIRESKYLGGDIEHTHLVKGLDYSLLNKARSEIHVKDPVKSDKIDIETAFKSPVAKQQILNDMTKTKMSRNICRTLFEAQPPVRNELFHRGRMAYVVELEDEAQSDVPVTLLRSTVECTTDNQNINTNNLLINKLSEVLSYLRSDGKKKKKDQVKSSSAQNPSGDKIFEDAGDYGPHKSSKPSRREREERRGHDSKSSYFDDRRRDDRDDTRDRDREHDRHRDRHSTRRRDEDSRRVDSKREPEKRSFTEEAANNSGQASAVKADSSKPKKSKLEEDDAYAELFPSGDMFYGGDDSDDEDFSKMDMGPRKGPVKRWDFDSQDAFEKYQGNREAMPKAVFQYGVKAFSGRKTRKANTAAEEKKYDREFEKITKLWEDRKQTKGSKVK